jgi:zinc protease
MFFVLRATDAVRASTYPRAAMSAESRELLPQRAVRVRNSIARRLRMILATTLGAVGLVAMMSSRASAQKAHETLRDPALVMGTLPNGLRYYLRANKSPAHRAEFRLVVNAGSMLEDEDQKGFAHFLEHMAFNGTKTFPHNSLVDFVEESGMVFGADVNAETSADETVYRFQLPTDDPKFVKSGLDILQDWAGGNMTIDSSEVLGERGVIMGEWRLNTLVDTASQSYRSHFESLWYADSRYRRRSPIGDTALIVKAEPGPIRRFYHDWYRPDLTAIVVVGDFDQQQMLAEITRRFGAIPARKSEKPRINERIKTIPEMVDVYRGFVSPSVQVLWPMQRQPATVEAAVRQDLVHDLLWQHLDHRMLSIREKVSRPFVIASVERGRVARPIEVEGFNIVAVPDSLNRALATVLGEIQRVVQHGMPEAALDHEKAALQRGFDEAAGSELARTSDTYADEYEAHFLRGEGVLLSSAQELTLSKQILPTITSAQIAEAAKTLWSTRATRRIYVGWPRFDHALAPTRKSILALIDSVGGATIPPEPAAGVAKAGSLLAHEPAPGTITVEARDSVAGTTTWTLSNGARVILKPTTNDPDEILLRASGPGGFSRMPDSLFYSPGRMVAKLMTAAAGLGEESRGALERPLETTGLRAFKVNIDYGSESIDLAASPNDQEMLFQQLYQQFTSPKFDTAAIHSWASLAKYMGPEYSLADQLNQIYARGEDRLEPVSTQMADLLHPDEALAAYKNRFGNAGQFTFFVVGAITPEKARPLVERYIASLPGTGERETVKPLEVAPFYRRADFTTRPFEIPKAETSVLFDVALSAKDNDYLRARQELNALMVVVQDRIRIRIREELGGSYSPFISSSTYSLPNLNEPDEHFRVIGGFTAAPESMPMLWHEYTGILDSVRLHGASKAELERASTIAKRQHETAMQSNGFWMSAIERFDRLKIAFGKIVDPNTGAPLSGDELRDAARRFLPSDAYIHITALPQDTVPKADSGLSSAKAP